MTGQEMIHEFKLKLDKVDSLALPNFIDSEIYSMLNSAYELFITERCYPKDPNKASAEETQRRVDDLRNITSNYSYNLATISSVADNKPNGFFVPLPSDYRHALSEEVALTYTECNATVTKRQKVVPRTHDEYNTLIEDPFNKPYEKEVIRLPYSSNKYELITGSFITLGNYYLRYYKIPLPISDTQTCELAVHTHREIVELAVSRTLEGIESPRYSSNINELSKNE